MGCEEFVLLEQKEKSYIIIGLSGFIHLGTRGENMRNKNDCDFLLQENWTHFSKISI
jgi:hypothetical protein